MLEPHTFATDPLLALMLAECETVEDEYEATALGDQYESFMLAAQHKPSSFQSQE